MRRRQVMFPSCPEDDEEPGPPAKGTVWDPRHLVDTAPERVREQIKEAATLAAWFMARPPTATPGSRE